MTRILFQMFLIIMPLVMFALYRLATRNRREPGESWPVVMLVLAGLFLSAVFYLFIFFKDPREERTCSTPPTFENGQIIPGRIVPCEGASIDSRKHEVKPDYSRENTD